MCGLECAGYGAMEGEEEMLVDVVVVTTDDRAVDDDTDDVGITLDGTEMNTEDVFATPDRLLTTVTSP